MTEKEKIKEMLEEIARTAFNAGVGCGHPLSTHGKQDEEWENIRWEIQELLEKHTGGIKEVCKVEVLKVIGANGRRAFANAITEVIEKI